MFVYFSKNIAFYKFFCQALLIKISNYILYLGHIDWKDLLKVLMTQFFVHCRVYSYPCLEAYLDSSEVSINRDSVLKCEKQNWIWNNSVINCLNTHKVSLTTQS